MAIAWIGWRDVTKVRDQWDKYRKAWSEYATEQNLSDGQAPMLRASVVTVSIRSRPKAALIRLLLNACAENKITAIGKNATGRPVEIQSYEFSSLSLHSVTAAPLSKKVLTPGLGRKPPLDGFEDVLVFDEDRFEPAYVDIKFRRDEIKKIWPVMAAGKAGRPPTYDWPLINQRIVEHVKKRGRSLKDTADLIALIRLIQDEIDPNKSPDDKTIREAIKTHGLDVAAGVKPGNRRR